MNNGIKVYYKRYILIFTFLISPALFSEPSEDLAPEIASASEVNDRIIEKIDLLDSFHEINSRYQFTNLASNSGSQSGGVNLLDLNGFVALWPKLHVGGDLPIFVGGSGADGEVFVGNPQIGLKSRVYSNIQREYPHFIYMKGWLQFPRKSTNELLVNRTDIGISSEIKKIFYRFVFDSKLGFVARIDAKNASRKYGDELFAEVGGEYHFLKLPLIFETSLLWRNAWSAVINNQKIPTQSILTANLILNYEAWSGVWIEGGVDIPLKSGSLGETAAIFGDYAASGLWGTTYSLNLKYQF